MDATPLLSAHGTTPDDAMDDGHADCSSSCPGFESQPAHQFRLQMSRRGITMPVRVRRQDDRRVSREVFHILEREALRQREGAAACQRSYDRLFGSPARSSARCNARVTTAHLASLTRDHRSSSSGWDPERVKSDAHDQAEYGNLTAARPKWRANTLGVS